MRAGFSPFARGLLRRVWRSRGGAVLATLAVVGFAAVAGVLATVHLGLYNVSATEQHTAPVYGALETGMRNAVRLRARGIEAPSLEDPVLMRRGFDLHRDACVPCHGAPGVAPHDAGKALLPVPNNLVQTAREWNAAEIYWVVRDGLKMTGMPAWGMRYGEQELWAIVAFVKELPRLSAADYQALNRSSAVSPAAPDARDSLRPGDPRRGVLALQQYACTTCHLIPGMVGADAHVGPPLSGIAGRRYLAGRLPNSPENMVRWIRDPRGISAATLMPDLKVSEQHARDMTAYLYTLEDQPRPGRGPSGEVSAGRAALERYQCGVCHTIPGIADARGLVGPPLTAYARRPYIAGKLPQDPSLLARWIQDAPALAPGTAMPNVGVTAADARDIVAYLYRLH